MTSALLHSELSPEQMTFIVVIRVAHRTLSRYVHGDLQALDSLTPKVAEWLETHGYIESVLDDESVHYVATDKAQRAILDTAA